MAIVKRNTDYLSSHNIDFSRLVTKEFPELDLSIFTDREKIEIMEWAMARAFDNIADDLPVRHFVHGGMYTRELTIPADTLLTGKVHTKEHICMLSKGHLAVMTDDGMKYIKAPYTFKARSGLKKIGYAISDCVFTTINTTDLTDIKEIENELLVDSDLTWVDQLFEEQVKICQVQQ